MSSTVVIQFRVPVAVGRHLDKLAEAGGAKRSDVARRLLSAALNDPASDSMNRAAAAPPATATSLDDIADRLGELLAYARAGRDASQSAARAATAAHAAAKLGALMLLPTERQSAFVNKLSMAVDQ